MVLCMAFFTLNDTVMKGLSAHVPLSQALFLRGVISAFLILIWALATGGLRLRFDGTDRRWLALRSLADIGASFFFLTALFHMPLANATAILQATPLAVTLAAALLFGERIGWRRLLAIAIGFLGVLLILRPGPDGFNIYAAYALAAVVVITIRDLSTRGLSSAVPSLSVALYATLAVAAFGAVLGLWEVWQPLTLPVVVKLCAASCLIFAAYLTAVQVMRVGEVGFVAPFRYTGLVWALLLGLLVFGDWPDPVSLAGAGLVVGSGLFTLLRTAALRLRR